MTILAHEMWVGFDAEYWAVVPGDPEYADSGRSDSGMPSPFWVNRFDTPVRRAIADVVAERRKRLDRLDVALPLQIPLGAPEDAVLDSLLHQAGVHIRRISDALHADPEVAAAPLLPDVVGDESLGSTAEQGRV